MTKSAYFWSDVQKELLKSAYAVPKGGLKIATSLLGHEKSRATIATQASRMGLTATKVRAGKAVN